MKHWVVCAADYGFWGRCVFFLLFDNSRVSDLLACRFSGCVSGKIRMDCTVQSMPWDGRSIRILGHGVHSCVAPRTGCDARMRQRLLRADRGLELLDLVGLLPRELNVRAAEVTIRGGLQINRTFQIQLVDNRGGAQVEDLAYGGGDLAARHALLGAEGLHVDGYRVGNANSVGDLDLDLVGQAGSHDVLRNPTGGVRGGTIDLGRVLVYMFILNIIYSDIMR